MYSLIYLLKLYDSFLKNENPILQILIEKTFEQKIYFCTVKMRSFLKEWKSNFSDQTWIETTETTFSTSCKKFKIFPFVLFETGDWPKAYAARRPKAVDSPLLFVSINIDFLNFNFILNS